MKALSKKYPNTISYLLALILFALALMISVIANKGIIKAYFPFIAVIALTVATWYLYKRENKSLIEIGLNFNVKNLLLLPLGVLIAAGTFLFAKYVRAIVLGETLQISSEINVQTILFAFYFILPTVAVEEFLFRGYLFKKTVELGSVVKANILFAVLFTLIHVMDDQVLNSPGIIVLLIISIPCGHLLFATAMLKSKSIYFPIGLHLGNNWATRHLVSGSADGHSIFYVTDATTFDTWTRFILFLLLWNSIFLGVTFLIWKWDKIPFFNLKKGKIKLLANEKQEL